MTPSESIVHRANTSVTTVDRAGRHLVLRKPGALDTLRLLKAAGPALALNEPWLAMAGLVFSVTEIDGIPVPLPTTEQQIEALVERLGDDGLDAIVQSLQPGETDGSFGTHVGNLPSTLS